ncbi:uncharacterized protein FOMMEDRAFT_23978 [Fomitiporia mediterranea MF3/22]|uniref:uncharacterized protein n=1 Tax=Fomitiporia mediterranea (strain MF3/22) TaxID=694068 RepID=UPI00044096BF|nr:uncharacterized protein FOMMEDRAFT_23978 [Fomitiporia mediterranea MF3/22]EJC97924.1 hypothetical protein FOMMEDRAFT_23978 [Fomitiporia mediterranea MF3/22]
MNSPPELASPSPSTESSGSPPPDETLSERAALATASQTLANLSQAKRRLASGPTANRDLKSRRRDDGSKRSFIQGDLGVREGARKEEFVDNDLMEKLKQEFGDPFDESDLKALTQ